MMSLCDVLLIHLIRKHAFLTEPSLQQLQKQGLEIRAEGVDVLVGILGHQRHLPQVSLTAHVTLESVRITTLLLTHLTVELQLSQSLGFDTNTDRLGCEKSVLGHFLKILRFCRFLNELKRFLDGNLFVS
jgi:hypothetical protein